jgi:hypothetical protein
MYETIVSLLYAINDRARFGKIVVIVVVIVAVVVVIVFCVFYVQLISDCKEAGILL